MKSDGISDQLVYSTAKLVCINGDKQSIGTSFFVRDMLKNGRDLDVLVTNKHVARDAVIAEIIFTEEDNNRNPIDDSLFTICITDLQSRLIMHPDNNIDICFILINDLIKQSISNQKRPYYSLISRNMFIDEVMDNTTAVEDVLMIGYPQGIFDSAHNKPIVRKGITATGMKYDYRERPDFLLDIACFEGSSGSPVFVKETKIVNSIQGNGISFQPHVAYYFAGILHSTIYRDDNGLVSVKEIPTSLEMVAETRTYLSLGVVTKSNQIISLLDTVKDSPDRYIQWL